MVASRVCGLLLVLMMAWSVPVFAEGEAAIPAVLPVEELAPYVHLDCPIDYTADGRDGASRMDNAISLQACYKRFIQEGYDENTCDEIAINHSPRETPPSYEGRVRDCYLGFAIAKNDPSICEYLTKERADCQMQLAQLTKNTDLCGLLTGDEKDTCFTSLGPTINGSWLFWFLPGILLYLVVGLGTFAYGTYTLSSEHKRALVLLSILTACIAPILLLGIGFSTEMTTDGLFLILVLPFVGLFFSAFAMHGWILLQNRVQTPWVLWLGTGLLGAAHGFATFFSAGTITMATYAWDGLAMILILAGAGIAGTVFLILYLLFYRLVRKK